VEVQEVVNPGASGRWMSVGSAQSVPFWPQAPPDGDKSLIFRVAGTQQHTLTLSLSNPAPILLQLNNAYGGLFIDFQVSESSVIVIVHAYEEGRAPILVVNHSPVAVDVYEGKDLFLQLEAEEACYYAWRMPNGNRSVTWGCRAKNQVSKDVRKSAMGSLDSTVAGLTIHWVSFLHNRQRILLFTADPALAIQLSYDTPTAAPVEQTVTVSLHSLAVSLIDNIQRREILYASITSSGITWETARMDRSRTFYRPMSIRDNLLLEEAYQLYFRSLVNDPNATSRREVDSGRMLVDFKTGRIFKPKERILRRSYRSGVELLYESYCNRTLIHARLNKIQVHSINKMSIEWMDC